MDRLDKQVQFILEIDKLKNILRRSYLIEDQRLETSSEHSWHVAVLASILAEHADEKIDTTKVIKILLFHDIVEIDAGDTFLYDSKGSVDKAEKESRAAERIFGLLPEDQAEEMKNTWDEYEARETPEAKFAYAMDRFMPILHNYHTQGKSWKEHKIRLDQVLSMNKPISEGSEKLWEYAFALINDAVAKGFLSES